jgi:transposase
VAGFLGLATSPHDSGDVERSQGISRAGRGQVRGAIIQAAWLWIKHQPKSAITRWFVQRTAGHSGRIRRIMIVAVARKLAMTREVYYRQFDNRRQVAGFLGLATSPHDSGDVERSQGISRAGRGQVRGAIIQAAWLWLKHQPKSAITRWFVQRTAGHSGRIRRIMIVAVARKLAIALWRFLEQGLVPQGAMLANR